MDEPGSSGEPPPDPASLADPALPGSTAPSIPSIAIDGLERRPRSEEHGRGQSQPHRPSSFADRGGDGRPMSDSESARTSRSRKVSFSTEVQSRDRRGSQASLSRTGSPLTGNGGHLVVEPRDDQIRELVLMRLSNCNPHQVSLKQVPPSAAAAPCPWLPSHGPLIISSSQQNPRSRRSVPRSSVAPPLRMCRCGSTWRRRWACRWRIERRASVPPLPKRHRRSCRATHRRW